MTPKRKATAERSLARAAERAAERDADADPETLALAPSEADAAQVDDELADLGVQLPEGALLTLWRLVEGGEKEFVDEQPVAGFTIAAVAARFGGGRYIMYLRRPHPDVAGRWLRAGSKTFRVLGPPRYDVTPAAGASAAAVMPGEAAKLAATYGELIQAQVKSTIENAQLLQQMQLAVVASLSQRPPDGSMELLKVILPLLMKDRGGDHPTFADVISLADRVAAKSSPTTQLKDTLELLSTARDLGGGGGDTPAWIPLAAKALDAIGGAVRQYAPPPALPPGDAIAPMPAPTVPFDVAPSTADEVPAVPTDAHPLLKWLAPMLPSLLSHAARQHDPITYAAMIADMIPESSYDDVRAYLASADFPATLHRTFPMILTRNVAPWFDELRAGVIAELAPDDATP